jgi:phytoene dehydrogenase-like protein
MDKIAPVLASLLDHDAPSLARLGAGDVWQGVKTAYGLRRLGRRDGGRLLRWMPMPVADLVDEWFDDELLKAAVAGPCLTGTMRGPRSAGSVLVLLLREASMHLARGRGFRARGGPGAVTRALAAAAMSAGAEIRTGSGVDRILLNKGHVTAVVSGGREVPATTVVSGLDPQSTFLRLIDPAALDATFVTRVRQYRAQGTLAKLNLALSGLPVFRGAGTDPAMLSGRLHLGPSLEYMERAFDRVKYGELPRDPWLDVTIPSLLDPGLAPRGAHVASVYVHYAPARLTDNTWARATGTLERSALDVLERYAPGIRGQIVAYQMLTPESLERDFGLSGGHIFHGELAPDQLWSARPLLGHERYATPVEGLFLCGAGTHPGGFMTGISGRLAARAVLRPRRETARTASS